MCALKFHTLFVKDKYKMAAICFSYVILYILHRNIGHEAKLELCFIKKVIIYEK